jgi:tetratricopeptide (TPR) repeat protein/predicted Ser/Thr protein kinase
MNARIEELFHEVADLPADARSRYFSEHCVDQDTRQEVEALLDFDSGASAFLLRDVAVAASRSLPQLEANVSRCGPYRLLDIVGRGGMGSVYLAERADGEVAQRVAIKLLPPGAGDVHRERFLQERQILAVLTHPNIARLQDAGHLDSGQPFLAMEYVDGQPIDVFAAALNVRQKIALFLKACAAVGYLHRNLIVHRDLKPNNILVTADGELKLLDFGIAKVLDLAARDSTMTSMRMLTPDYASPEQVTGARVSTATDIYSLGAVLYRLLTGKPAHEFADHSPEAIAYTVAGRDVTRPSRWVPELKGDLETILLKALRKDPQERYPTVEQLAEDLEAFLESRPVRARSGSTWYRARKALRRHWVPVSAAALVIASLSAGLYAANRQRVAANRQRSVAEGRFAQLRQLAHQVIFDVDPEIGALPGALNARKKLLSTSTQYLAGLGVEARGDKDLALEVAQSYIQIARVQGVGAWNNLGQFAEARESLRQADLFLDAVLAVDPDNRDALWWSANAAHDRASAANADGDSEQVIAAASRVRARFDHLASLGNLTRKEINGATYIYGDLADQQINLHRFDDAARYARAGIEISRTISTVPGPRAQAFSMLAASLRYMGNFQGTLDALKEARTLSDRLRREVGDSRYTRMVSALVSIQDGLTLEEDGGISLGRPLDAAAAFQLAYDELERSARDEPKDYHVRTALAEPGRYLGDVLRHRDPKRALEVYDHSLMRIREVPDDVTARRSEALLLAGSSHAARRLHHEDDARARIGAALRLLRDTRDYPAETIKPGREADITLSALADDYAETGQPLKAIDTWKELLRRIMASNPDTQNNLVNAVHISRVYRSLAALLGRVGRKDEAGTLAARRVELWQHWDRRLPDNPFIKRQLADAMTSPIVR